MLVGRNWHPERIFFMVSSARHFADYLARQGFNVRYVRAENTPSGLDEIWQQYGRLPTWSAEPSSFKQHEQLAELGVEFVPNDFFITSRPQFFNWAQAQKTYVMENFYRAQRTRLGILMDGKEPLGGRWNFDAENRKPVPKGHTWPPRLKFQRDEIDAEVASELKLEMKDTWATTREGALAALDHFLEHNLTEFGELEDAVTKEDWSLHHSLLSPYLNIGLITPHETVHKALERFMQGGIPLQSIEGFVRQIIGWREYVNGMYWFLGEHYQGLNELNANRKLLPLFTDSRRTAMNCVSTVVREVEERAWVHHIPRLMILSNLALLTGVRPNEFLDWMRENFIDASQWVMVPNVIGMGLHADGGKLMTKPYAGGGSYINKMTDFCKGCAFDPRARVGENACPFTTLYWDFMDRHVERFKRNHRMSKQVMGLNRLGDIGQLRERAAEVFDGLDRGVL